MNAAKWKAYSVHWVEKEKAWNENKGSKIHF